MAFGRVLGSDEIRLNPRDADFIFTEAPGRRSHMVAVHMFDATDHPQAQMTLDQAKEWTARRLHLAPFFTRRIRREWLDLDHPYWEPVEVDLDQHVHLKQVDRPGWGPVGEYLAEVVRAPVDLTRPPWEIHVVTGITDVHDVPGDLVAVFLKTHHSAGDGLAARTLTTKMYSDHIDEEPVAGGGAGAHPAVMATRAAASLPARLVRMSRRLRETKGAPEEFAAAEASGEVISAPMEPMTRLNGDAAGDISVDFTTFELGDIAAIRAAVPGATVNDVLLAAVAGGLSEYLGEIDPEPPTALAAKVPRSVRGLEKWDSANQLVMMAVPLHIDVRDPLERLRRIVESSGHAKRRSEHPAARSVGSRKDTTPSLLLKLAVRVDPLTASGAKSLASHTMISNIPLDADGLVLNGAPHAAVLPNQPPINTDLLRHFICRGTGTQLTMNVCAEVSAVPDLDRYLSLLRTAFVDIRDAAEKVGARG